MNAKSLSAAQERRLVDYVEDKFLEITRAYKKRSHPSTALPTLSTYLHATHMLLNLILQIPPIDPSTSLRTTLLLRLTGEIMTSIPGYSLDLQTLPQCLDWLEDLDHGWLAILRSQAWDPKTRTGVSIQQTDAPASSVSQTERARLRSLLITGTETLEEWLEAMYLDGDEEGISREKLDVETRFDVLFSETLSELGVLHGEML